MSRTLCHLPLPADIRAVVDRLKALGSIKAPPPGSSMSEWQAWSYKERADCPYCGKTNLMLRKHLTRCRSAARKLACRLSSRA